MVDWLYRVGILNLFKDCDPPRLIVEIDHHDRSRGLFRAHFWSRHPVHETSFFVGNDEIRPAFTKLRRFDFLDRLFVWEHIVWLPNSMDGVLTCSIDGQDAHVIVGKRQVAAPAVAHLRAALRPPHVDASKLSETGRRIRERAQSADITAVFRDAWLFIDRHTAAGDSAEHLYRHTVRRRPEINAFFVLRRDSADWHRLAAQGFRLLPFGELPHYLALLNAARIVSSHSESLIWSAIPRHETADLIRYKFALLQHEVHRDDLAKRLNDAPIHLIVTATNHDFSLIAADGSPYRYGRKETVLAGSPRQDALAAAQIGDDRLIVLAPAGRDSLFRLSQRYGGGSYREFEVMATTGEEFSRSEFAIRWRQLLHNAALADLARRTDYRVILLPHWQLSPHLDFFDVPDWVEIWKPDHSVVPLLSQLSVLVTDYSSYSADAAFIGKPVIYYSYEEPPFAALRSWQQSQFDLSNDGYGPVCFDEDALVGEIDEVLKQGPVASDLYRRRAAAAFPFQDASACERILDAITKLDQPVQG